MRVCSLFSGIGGIDLAFQQAGFDIVGNAKWLQNYYMEKSMELKNAN